MELSDKPDDVLPGRLGHLCTLRRPELRAKTRELEAGLQ